MVRDSPPSYWVDYEERSYAVTRHYNLAIMGFGSLTRKKEALYMQWYADASKGNAMLITTQRHTDLYLGRYAI